MMRNRKSLSIFIVLCLLFTFSSCNQKTEKPEQNVSDNKNETNTVEFLDLEKTIVLNDYRNEDKNTLFVKSEYSNIVLSQDHAGKYPELSKALDGIAVKKKKAMDEEYDNFVSFANEDLLNFGMVSRAYISTLDVTVRRADNIALSLLTDSYSDYGGIRNYRVFHGTNFDVQSGRELKISDVIKDMSSIPELIGKELDALVWTGEPCDKEAITQYFLNTQVEDISWTLDYNGVTFYFSPETIAEKEHGPQTITLTFASYPDLFNKKYTIVPDSYMVEIPKNSTFFTDFDLDGVCDSIRFSGENDVINNTYVNFGIYTDDSNCYFYEECSNLKLNLYYVKTANQNGLLYLFTENTEGLAKTYIFNLKDDEIKKESEMDVGLNYKGNNTIAIPADPNNIQ